MHPSLLLLVLHVHILRSRSHNALVLPLDLISVVVDALLDLGSLALKLLKLPLPLLKLPRNVLEPPPLGVPVDAEGRDLLLEPRQLREPQVLHCALDPERLLQVLFGLVQLHPILRRLIELGDLHVKGQDFVFVFLHVLLVAGRQLDLDEGLLQHPQLLRLPCRILRRLPLLLGIYRAAFLFLKPLHELAQLLPSLAPSEIPLAQGAACLVLGLFDVVVGERREVVEEAEVLLGRLDI
mmetsp:Transcript_1481/g.3552  ORF Transcript_1481/g.3552 Transcript_1481/m.3552 type:complete len:238 (-) Transcript_1481:2246-2959(-)